MSQIQRPQVLPDALSAAFFEGLQAGRLLVQVCEVCGKHQMAQYRCWNCGARSLRWVEASGRATLYSFTRIHMPYHPFYPPPYHAAIAELAEGPRVNTTVLGCEDADLVVGMPLKAEILVEGADRYLAFRPLPR